MTFHEVCLMIYIITLFLKLMNSIEIGGLFLLDELAKEAPNTEEGIGLAWSTIDQLCEGNVNFLFTTHFGNLRKLLKSNCQVKWGKFESFVRVERTTNKKILTFNHKIVRPQPHEEGDSERPDYG